MNIYKKIINSFTNQASAEEKAQIALWKKESEENLKALEELQSIHNNAEKLLHYIPVDKEAAWENIKAKAEIPESKVFKLPSWVKSLAAVFVLVSVAIYFFETSMIEKSDSQTLATTEKVIEHKLADGTVVKLDKNSSLDIIDERYVNLNGRANFNVSTTPDKDNFTIKLNGGKITVLGTQFTVLTAPEMLEVSVTEGHVKLDYEGRSMDLFANDVVRLFNNQLAIVKNNYDNTDSWLKQELIFKDEPLTNVLADLSRYFKQNIVLDKKIQANHNCSLTSKYKDPSIGEILEELKTIFNAEIIKQANSYVILSINCD